MDGIGSNDILIGANAAEKSTVVERAGDVEMMTDPPEYLATCVRTEELLGDLEAFPPLADIGSPEHQRGTSMSTTLASSGLLGTAAACAINSCRWRRPSSANSSHKRTPSSTKNFRFESNPAVRKRIQNRLLRKLRECVEEYCVRVGEQAVVVAVRPDEESAGGGQFRCFGSQPLESVMHITKPTVMSQLRARLRDCQPVASSSNPADAVRLPPLVFDGIPTALDQTTQMQLRAFIPKLLKSVTGRSKPSWGRQLLRPPWWPAHLPFQNVKTDFRTDEQRRQSSWTEVLRDIIRACYKFYGKEDMLTPMMEEETEEGEPEPGQLIHLVPLSTDSDAGHQLRLLDSRNQVLVVPFHSEQLPMLVPCSTADESVPDHQNQL